MQKYYSQSKISNIVKTPKWNKIPLYILIILPLVSLTIYSSPIALAQNEQQNTSSEDNIVICQIINENESSVGSQIYQASSICDNQNSIGSSQALAELCYLFNDKSNEEISKICDQEISNQMTTPSNETNETLGDQNMVNNQTSESVFDGISKFFSGLFNP